MQYVTCKCALCGDIISTEEIELYQACMMTDSVIPIYCRPCFFNAPDPKRYLKWKFTGTVPNTQASKFENKYWDNLTSQLNEHCPYIAELFTTNLIKWPGNIYKVRVPIEFTITMHIKRDDVFDVSVLANKAVTLIKHAIGYVTHDIHWDNQELGHEEKSISTNF